MATTGSKSSAVPDDTADSKPGSADATTAEDNRDEATKRQGDDARPGEAYGGAVNVDEAGKTVGGPPVSDPDQSFEDTAAAAQAWASTDPMTKSPDGTEGVTAAGAGAVLPPEDERGF